MANPARSEKKSESFRRLASQRTTAVLQRIRVLGNCANRQLYDYSDDDVRKVFVAIEKELRLVKAKFHNSHRPDFSL